MSETVAVIPFPFWSQIVSGLRVVSRVLFDRNVGLRGFIRCFFGFVILFGDAAVLAPGFFNVSGGLIRKGLNIFFLNF